MISFKTFEKNLKNDHWLLVENEILIIKLLIMAKVQCLLVKNKQKKYRLQICITIKTLKVFESFQSDSAPLSYWAAGIRTKACT